MRLFDPVLRERDVALALFPGIDLSKPWWMRLPYVYWVPALLTGLLVWSVPLDAMSRWPALHAFCVAVLKWFPFLGNHAAYSAFPSYITAVKCVTFVTVPVLVLLPFLFVWRHAGKCLDARVDRGFVPVPWFHELAAIGLVVLMLVGLWVVGQDPRGFTTKSVLGLALIHASAAAVLAMLPISICTALYVRAGLAHYKQRQGRRS